MIGLITKIKNLVELLMKKNYIFKSTNGYFFNSQKKGETAFAASPPDF
jgi:hypothetical protein